jgi:DUF218 domain
VSVLQNKNSVSLAASDKTEQWHMDVRNKSMAVLFALVLLLMMTGVYYAPRFLACADKPVKSDAIILFLGPNPAAREKEAHFLFNEGYARFLIVPGLQQVISTGGISPQLSDVIKNTSSSGAEGYPSYYEKTHLEVLYAEKMINALKLKSAIMVSSPYHMKRIKMICEKTFGEQARYISYVPTSYEPGMTDMGHIDRADIRPLMLEFAKIVWFNLYSFFSGKG